MDVDDFGLRDDVRRALGVVGDAAAPPPVFDQLAVTPPGPTRQRAVRWFASAAVVVALVAGLAWIAGRDPDGDVGLAPPDSESSPNDTLIPGSTDGTTSSSAPSTAAAGDWSWLDAFGSEAAHPTAPDGWRWQDVEGLRFAVPGDWVTPIAPSCAPRGAGIVLTPATFDSATMCEPSPGDPPASVVVRPSPNDDQPGTAVTVGTRSAQELAGPTCGGCPTTYRFDDGLDMTVTGPDSSAIIATITDVGADRVLQAGPIIDTLGWRKITFETISVEVPAEWGIVDLPGSYQSDIDPDGNQSISGNLNPGSCTQTLFDPTNRDTAWLGSSPILPRCLAQTTLSIEPVDAIWIREDSDTDGSTGRGVIASGRTNGLNIEVLAPLADQLGSQLDLVASDANHRVIVTLGIGTDAATTRTILRSLRTSDSSEPTD